MVYHSTNEYLAEWNQACSCCRYYALVYTETLKKLCAYVVDVVLGALLDVRRPPSTLRSQHRDFCPSFEIQSLLNCLYRLMNDIEVMIVRISFRKGEEATGAFSLYVLS